MLSIYGSIIKDQEKRGFVEKVNEETDKSTRIHYIPHHAVKKDSATTLIRIVYDCSCRESIGKASLNDCLMSVPPLMNDLTGIITRFRLHKFAVTTNIEKAFLQIQLDEEDRDVTRFLWFSDPTDPTSPLMTYRFRVVLFGTTCSPFMLNATIMKRMKNNLSDIARVMKRDWYVDNVLSSFHSEENLLSFYKESRQLLSKGVCNLRSWTSNNLKLRYIAESEDCMDKDTPIQILGLRWNTETDTISFQNSIKIEKGKFVTKREILQQSSRIFDPLGVLSPITVRAKILMQTIWDRKFDWDQPLPNDIKSKWYDLLEDLQKAVTFEVPRFHFANESFTDINIKVRKLHVFTDASQSAYGACVYIVNGDQSTLVMAKNSVAPLKQITLPRLELMGALTGARLANHLLENIGDMNLLKISNGNIARRNADLQTRGSSADKFLNNELWTHGPKWIINETKWPIWNGNTTALLTNAEFDIEPNLSLLTSTQNQNEESGLHRIINLDHFSNLRRLLGVTAYVYRFINNCRSEINRKTSSCLLTDEIRQSVLVWIRNIQNTTFNFYDKPDKRSSIFRQLKLFKDDNEIFRCGGRIHNATLSENTKFPYLLLTKHNFTDLVISDAHVNHLHSGLTSTVTYLRQSYWIPRIIQCVRTVLRKCVTCRKVTGKAYQKPDPPPLPVDRVQDTFPFTVTGVDFAGPLYVKKSDNSRAKVYICLLTCASTRAVHLEIVSNLTEESFILAFRRFVSRRSLPKTMISDNAATYIAASTDIQRLTNSQSLQEKLQTQGIEWKFIPKGAPWYGGFWERMVGLTKTTLKKVLGSKCICMDTLQTVITDIESALNDRPITYVSSDVNEREPLTSSHLLCGRRIRCLPYPSTSMNILIEFKQITHNSLKKRLQGQHNIIQHFRRRWKNEYLTSLREYHTTRGHNNQTIKIGDVVQIHEDSPRINWKLAIIDELLVGKDGLVRAVNLHTNNGHTNRPISKLYPIEVSCDLFQSTDDTKERKSKKDAREKIRQLMS